MYQIWNDRLGEYYRGVFPTFEAALTKMEILGWLREQFHRVRICDMDGNDIQIFDPQ